MEEVAEVIVEVKDIARGGAGVAKDAHGRVIFVPKTAPGDKVRVRVMGSPNGKKHYAQGELMEILEPSSLRQKPRCPAFGRCGGCEWQHLPYELQWKTKSNGVQHALARVQIEVPWASNGWDEFPAERIWEYRNRVQLRGFKGELGFYAAGSHDLVAVDRCEIARPEINAVWAEVREEGAKMARPFKVELEVRGTPPFVHRTWNSSHSAMGFRQVHDDQNEKLRAWIASVLSSSRLIYDLFGGSGNLSLPLATGGREVHCVDLSVPTSPSALAEAPKEMHYHRAAVLSWLMRLRTKKEHARGAAILDPPRQGLGADSSEIVDCLQKIGVNELVAVGCDPDSWARDVARFIRRGWKLEKVAVFDLFPQTPHVESVGLLRL